jgi:hypothetical protein
MEIVKSNKMLSAKELLLACLVALFLVWYTDFIAYTKFGYIICLLLTLFIILYSLVNFTKALLLSVAVLFLFPVYPRDILTIYSALQIYNEVEFYSILYSKFLGFAFAQWIFLGLGTIAFFNFLHIKKFFLNKKVSILLMTLLFVWSLLYLATLNDVLNGRNVFSLKEFISDQRYFIILLSGILATFLAFYKDKNFHVKLLKLLFFIGITTGLKVLLFIIEDYILNNTKFYFSTLPYLLYPLLLSLIFINPKLKNLPVFILVFLGSFNISRGDILFMIIDTLLFIIVTFVLKNNILVKIRRLNIMFINISLFTILPFVILYILNEKVLDFLLLKLRFFNNLIEKSEFSKSTLVRIYEFKNIISENSNDILSFLLGKGFGGYFTFSNYPFPMEFDISDYTLFELNSNIFFHPHTFINYTLLKGGLVFLIFYLGISLYFFVKGITLIKVKNYTIKFLGAYSLFYSLFSLNSYWLPQYIFLNGVLITVLVNIGVKNG